MLEILVLQHHRLSKRVEKNIKICYNIVIQRQFQMAKKKHSNFDEFDDSFVDKKEFSKPSIVSNESDDSNHQDNTTSEDAANDLVDVIVLNVDITGYANYKILRFDVIEYTSCSARYTSWYYCLDFAIGTNGIFEMLDDYFAGRFRFLHSSKTCQAFMVALAVIEHEIKEKNKTSLFELCKMINTSVVEKLKNEVDEEPDDVLWNGYGIVDEAICVFNTKRSFIEKFDTEYYNTELLKHFNFYKEYANTKHFCAICVQFNDEYIKPNIIEDPAISLPLISYIPKFTKIICEKVAHLYLSTDVFQNIGVEEMNTDVYLLMPETRTSDICSLYDKQCRIKDYDGLESNDFITAKYKTYTFTEEEYLEHEDELDSIIGFA